MDGAAAAPKSLADCGHTEPRRGAEWWGEDLWLLLGPSKVTRCQSGTLSGRYRSNGYTRSNCVDCQAAFASKPAPTVGSLGVR